LVSDGGMQLAPQGGPARNWFGHAYRVVNLLGNDVRSLRKRLLIASYQAGERKGAYWGIGSEIAHYGLADALPCPPGATEALAQVATRLARLDESTQLRLINWGYAVCDAAMRTHVNPALPTPPGFPYPKAGVGPEANGGGVQARI
jgi:NTE family protein